MKNVEVIIGRYFNGHDAFQGIISLDKNRYDTTESIYNINSIFNWRIPRKIRNIAEGIMEQLE